MAASCTTEVTAPAVPPNFTSTACAVAAAPKPHTESTTAVPPATRPRSGASATGGGVKVTDAVTFCDESVAEVSSTLEAPSVSQAGSRIWKPKRVPREYRFWMRELPG